MTPEAIVATAAQEGLGIVAITDHNEIGNVEPALRQSSLESAPASRAREGNSVG
jgi:predicted metal-dependent phosphoesterase TrpH